MLSTRDVLLCSTHSLVIGHEQGAGEVMIRAAHPLPIACRLGKKGLQAGARGVKKLSTVLLTRTRIYCIMQQPWYSSTDANLQRDSCNQSTGTPTGASCSNHGTHLLMPTYSEIAVTSPQGHPLGWAVGRGWGLGVQGHYSSLHHTDAAP